MHVFNEALKKKVQTFTWQKKYPGKVEKKLLTVPASRVWKFRETGRRKEKSKGDFYFSLYILLCSCCILKLPHNTFFF